MVLPALLSADWNFWTGVGATGVGSSVAYLGVTSCLARVGEVDRATGVSKRFRKWIEIGYRDLVEEAGQSPTETEKAPHERHRCDPVLLNRGPSPTAEKKEAPEGSGAIRSAA